MTYTENNDDFKRIVTDIYNGVWKAFKAYVNSGDMRTFANDIDRLKRDHIDDVELAESITNGLLPYVYAMAGNRKKKVKPTPTSLLMQGWFGKVEWDSYMDSVHEALTDDNIDLLANIVNLAEEKWKHDKGERSKL